MRRFYSSFFSPLEAKKLIKLGVPVYIAQLSGAGMNFADTVMTGQYNAVDMAAVAVASAVWNPIALFGIGILLVLTPFSAQLVGEGRVAETPHILRQGIWCSLFLAIPLMLTFYIISLQMGRFGLEPDLAELSKGYLQAVLWGLPGWFLFINVRGLLEGFSRTRPAMVISIMALILNVPINYILIYGKFGLPALGAVGCGVATAICFWFMGLCMVFFVRRDAQTKALGNLFLPLFVPKKHEKRIDWHTILRVFRVGLPGALAMLFEVSLFAVSALILAPLGTIIVAGHQVAMNVVHLLFILPLSISITSTIRVGYCLGAGQLTHARLTAWTAICLGVMLSFLGSLGMVVFREAIALTYTSDPEVITIAMNLLLFGAAFQMVDAIQIVGIGILRGYNDTRIIFIICFVAYWIVGFPLGIILSRTDWLGPSLSHLGAQGFWIAFILALIFGACCYSMRIVNLQRRSGEDIYEKIHR